MDRYALKRKSLNTQRQRVDRFVLPQENIDNMRRRKALDLLKENCNMEIWYSKYLQQKKFLKCIDEAFEFTPLKYPQDGLYHDHSPQHEPLVTNWPCMPRSRKYLSLADSILDLPGYSDADFPELLDWNCDNILIAALGRNYHKWSWQTQAHINQGETNSDIFCCKFHPEGKLMAFGTKKFSVEIHDISLRKLVDSADCACIYFGSYPTCSITAVEWSPTGCSYITGCSNGILVSRTKSNEIISTARRTAGSTIMSLKISPDSRYISVASVNSDTVYILTWPELAVYTALSSKYWTVKTLAWHPWRSALLAMGGNSTDVYSRIVLWEVPAAKYQDYRLGLNTYYIDSMLFNHKSGELIVSLWNPDPGCKTRLVVMSDPDTAVDEWGEERHLFDRIRHMIFSSDGTMLATATSEEDLIIWNFLPDNKKKNTKRKNFSALPVYFDKLTHGFSLR
ncbi:protein cortex-like [Battus philenor]|uniref:protein cortex-like n=1 Tax=Battus philenor TaxID=42288 RepID=UPI0035CF2366